MSKTQKQKYGFQPSVAHIAISLLLFTVLIFNSTKTKAQVFDSINFHLDVFCSSGGTNAGDPQTICQNEVLHLSGIYDTVLNGTAITWTNISNQLLPANTNSTTITTSFVTTPTTALNANITFTAPGVYMFRLSAHCNTSYTINSEGDTIFANLDDTVRITVLPIPNANAGTNIITCLQDIPTYGNNVWYANLSANSPSTNQIGIWHVNGFNYIQDTTAFGNDLNNPNAIFRRGLYGNTYTLFWTLIDTLTNCQDRDTVLITIPGESSPVWAPIDTICSNAYLMNANQNYSSTGISATQYLPYVTALSTSDTTFFTFYQTSGPDTATFTNYGGGNINISITTAGTYHFVYWLHGFCVNDTASFAITFLTATPITPTIGMNPQTVCNPTDTFLFVNTMPDTLIGETSEWHFDPGLIPISDTTNQDSVYVIWDGTTALPLEITYIIINADTASGCNSSRVVSLRPLIVPEIHASPDTVLLCGSTSCNFSYEYRKVPGGTELDQLSISLVNPTIINYPVGGSGATIISGWAYGSYTTPPLYSRTWHIEGMSVPGIYSVLISCYDFCGGYYTDTIHITIDQPPSGSNAGNEIILLCGETVTELQANIPIIGTGSWSVFDDGSGFGGLPTLHPLYSTQTLFMSNFLTPFIPNPTVSGFTATGTYYFEWIVCNPNCPAPFGDGCYHNTISVTATDTSGNTAIAGNDTTLCDTTAFQLYTLGQQGLPGTWTQLFTNPDSVSFSNVHTDNPFVYGLSASGIYGFVWSVPAGCGNLSDTMYVTYQPENCCFAMNNPVYQQWIGDTTISQNFVMNGKYYIEGIVTVTNSATLDVTNVDLVFANCAGIDFERGTNIRANNSVLRPCNIADSWRGLQFADSTFGVIENCSFKNAIYGINLIEGTNAIRIFNNTFANNYTGINARSATLNEAITGNTFTIDNSFVDFYKGACALSDTFDLNFFNQPGYIANYGIIGGSSTFNGLLSQNHFINGSDPDDNHLFYGIFGLDVFASIANNTFTNMFRSVDIGNGYGVSVFNNKIDIALNGEPSESDFRYLTQIRVSQSTFSKINNNVITSSFKVGNDRFTLWDVGANIYNEDNQNTEILDNICTGGLNQISLFNCTNTYIKNNVLKECQFTGIYAANSMGTDITCNEIFMTDFDNNSNYGITINDIDNSSPALPSLIRNNCVFDASIAINVYANDCYYIIPTIYNNFLYNYSVNGIYVEGTGNIGTNVSPARNTLISNNAGNGSIDVAEGLGCTVNIAGNYGLNSVAGNVNVVNTYSYNSSASCANQITEYTQFTYNQKLEMNKLTGCASLNFDNDSLINIFSGEIRLAKTFQQQILNWKQNEMLVKADGLFNLLAATNNQTEVDKVYNLILNSGKLNSNEQRWLNYYYNFAKGDYQTSLNELQNISFNDENEKYLIQIETIKTNMRLNQTTPTQLPLTVITELKNIVAARVEYSPMASDLLKLAIDGYDYPFTPMLLKTPEQSKNVKSLKDNLLNVWPNPASDILQLEFTNASDANAVIVINDAKGQIVYSRSTNIKAGKLIIDITSLSKGLYHLQLLGTNDKKLVSTFIKQ